MTDKFQLKALITGVDKLSPMLKGIQGKALSMRKKLESSGLGKISIGEVAAGGAMAAPFVMAVKSAMDFESKMADVKKVVDFKSPEQFQQMSKDVLGLSRELPMAASGIAQIVAAGGQAGIPREELKGFASDAVKMGVAFDQTADEAGQMMATWRTAFKMGQGDVNKLADQVNYLGNTGPASAKKISSVVTSIGPLGAVAGLASGQIAAMGATLIGMGTAEDVAATGMKNFMLSLTAGASATKSQQETFKALRLDSKQVAVGMQKDAQGTIMRVLNAVSKVDKSKQAAVLSNLFGKESIGAIAPLLTNLDLLKSNFEKVADATQYGGSMNKEYAARAATTANNLQLLMNRATEVGIVVGTVLLPPFNDFMGTISPVVSVIGDFAGQQPWLIKGVLGAAAGMLALRLGVMGATVAMKLFSAVTSMSPIGLLVRGIALGAGFLIANWSSVAPFFEACWDKIKEYADIGWSILKTVWSWSPMGLIVQNWEPILGFFKGLWEKVSKYIEPIINGVKWAANKVGSVFSSDSGVPSTSVYPMGGAQSPVFLATSPSFAPRAPLAAATSPLQQRQSPLESANAAAAQKQQLKGEVQIKFENPPPGMRADTKVNTPGVEFFSTGNVGRRSLGNGPAS